MRMRTAWIVAGIAAMGLFGTRSLQELDIEKGAALRDAARTAKSPDAGNDAARKKGLTQASAPRARDGSVEKKGLTQASAPRARDGSVPFSPDVPGMESLQENIRKAEYNITWQDTCVIPGEPGGLHAANRANNLRAYFREDGVQIVERETSNPEWDLRWRFTGWGRVAQASPPARNGTLSQKDGSRDGCATNNIHSLSAVTPIHCGNRVEYDHGAITEWYENTETGLEHGFTIFKRPH